MAYRARLQQHGPIWRLWRENARTGGAIHGVIFYWHVGNVYQSDLLSREQAALLAGNAQISLEAVDDPVVTAEAPDQAPESLVATLEPRNAPVAALEPLTLADEAGVAPPVQAGASEAAAAPLVVPVRAARPMRR